MTEPARAYISVADPATTSARLKSAVEEADTLAYLILPKPIADLIHAEFHALSRCEWFGQVINVRALVEAVHQLHKTLKDIP